MIGNEIEPALQLICTLLILLFGILAAVVITVQITRPVRETLDTVERIAAGDLTQNLVVTRSDELGMLQQGIQRMGETLRDLIGGIRDGVTQILNRERSFDQALWLAKGPLNFVLCFFCPALARPIARKRR